MLSKFIENINVGKNYDLKISFRVSFAQFCEICEDIENELDKTNSQKYRKTAKQHAPSTRQNMQSTAGFKVKKIGRVFKPNTRPFL